MDELQKAIENLVNPSDLRALRLSSQFLSACYREGGSLTSKEELFTYLIVRLPATSAALKAVLSELPKEGSVLDLGAGPGTLYWAARAIWENPPPLTFIEREKTFIELGKQLGSKGEWIEGDLLSFETFAPHDWVLFSYSLSELKEKYFYSLFDRAWRAAQKGIIIVEPGTPQGYQRMLRARDYFISLGGFVWAPCPHSRACPLPPSDWCHFSVRFDRSFAHKYAKLASLPYEDEKFAYVILTKEKLTPPPCRVIAPPQKHSGHILLSLCMAEGLEKRTISRRQKEIYKQAKKVKWGDAFLISISRHTL